MSFTEDDILRACGPRALAAGRQYNDRNRVRLVDEYDDDETVEIINTRVRGSAPRPYDQSIMIGPGSPAIIEGECTCPVGFNCKHVAAALLFWLDVEGPIEAAPPKPPSSEQRIERLLAAGLRPADLSRDGLPHDLALWLNDLGEAQVAGVEAYPPTVNQRLIYVLAPIPAAPRADRLGLRPVSTRLLKDGSPSKAATNVDPGTVYQRNPAKYLRPSDLRILRVLARARDGSLSGVVPLTGEEAGEVLPAVLATGRARWGDVDGPILAQGQPRPGRVEWQSLDDVATLPRIVLDDGGLVLAATPPVYVDPAAGLVGPVESGLPPRVAAALLDTPPVPAATVPDLDAALARRVPGLAALRPPARETERLEGVAPVPVLRLFRADLPQQGWASAFISTTTAFRPPTDSLLLARLSFRYGPMRVALGEPRETVTRLSGNRLVTVTRDRTAERDALRRLIGHGFVPLTERRPQVPPAHAHDLVPEGDADWRGIQYRVVPALREDGFETEVADDFPGRVVRVDGTVEAEIREGSGIDWLELGLGVEIDGERVDLVEAIVAMIAAPDFDAATFADGAEGEAPVYLPLPDGRVLGLPAARLVPIVEAIRELALGGPAGEGPLRLSRADAASLALFEDATAAAGLVWRGGERIREMGRRLTAGGGIPPAILPESFRATLRPYQEQGVAWLAFLRDVGFGGILADDMGLGKTVQALGLIAIEKARGSLDRPALVVAPTSLMANWRREAERFAPDLRVLVLHGLDRKAQFGAIAEHDLVLTTYPLIARDHEVLSAQDWHMLILDEAQTIKNPDAATTQLIHGLKAGHRFCLSGTPLENNLGELWSLFSFACPGLLGERRHFTTNWRTPIEKRGDGERGRLLARRVRPFLLRRTKEEVATELPPKTEITETVEFGGPQRDLYESIRLSMHARVREAIAAKGFARSRIVILDALLKLRQACCDPRLLKLEARQAKARARQAGSAKLDRLEELLAALIEEGRRVLVFSQFTSMLDLIRPRLDAAGLPYALLTGRTRDREAAVRHFEEGRVPVFLISLKAGGTGLNLVSADTVILYDPWWNPAVEEQAVDRAHRIGQDKPVFVHRLVAARTIEEKMELLKEKKSALAQSLFDPDGTPTLAMTEADLDVLLGT
ncbi:MAG: DEAD/DEAH box helicase [Methylobacterium frigidaeris]